MGVLIIPIGILNESSVVYSGGVGEDMSFDLKIQAKYNCNVVLIDPTKKAVKHYEEVKNYYNTENYVFEGNIISQIKDVEPFGWFAVMYAGIIISILGHMMMFYLYKFYSVGVVMPFYSLFPVFGLILTFFIFGEVPSLMTIFGGLIVITSIYLLQKTR